MKTTGYLIPEVRTALRRGDCAGARILIGDAQRGHLSARQQTTVRRLLQTVERCDIRQGVGQPTGLRQRVQLRAPSRRAAGDDIFSKIDNTPRAEIPDHYRVMLDAIEAANGTYLGTNGAITFCGDSH